MKIKLIDFGVPEHQRPYRPHGNDAGADVYLPYDCTLQPGEIAKIPLGFGLEIPDGYAMGCKAIVVKGGHHIGNAVDVLFNGENFYHFETSRIDTKNTHGTGCTFSSAIASQLAKGKSVPLAVESAKAYVTMAIEHSLAIGKGCGPTHHFYELYQHGLSKE